MNSKQQHVVETAPSLQRAMRVWVGWPADRSAASFAQTLAHETAAELLHVLGRAGKAMAVHIQAEWSSPAPRGGLYAPVTVHLAVVEQFVRLAPSQDPRDRS
ncbi:hypothetical protein EA798_07800 [Pseudomonas songnenensis]|uniref:Uncharacterized protein n=1 Tax=Pseudomonas songnenensis TaxID=1176259 RepID=A0ABX9UY18_9PSED|nr:hypothetical protein EA798_07800 [Pseudomonas songnenensis]